MIITGLKAENLLKYAKLELSDLPQQGIIAISGQNESGKSAIGEMICFALFGRTFSCGPEALSKLIRWGEPRYSVQLDFVAKDGKEYQIARFIDEEGSHCARLSLAGQGPDPIVVGVDAVTNVVVRLLGFDFEEFIESFYLAQREITNPHSHSHALKAMAGLAALEQARLEFKQEIAQERLAMAEIKPQITSIEMELAALDIHEGFLQSLEKDKAALDQVEEAVNRRVETLESGARAYQKNIPKVARTRRGRNVGRVLRVLLAVATLWSIAQALQGVEPTFTWILSAIVFAGLFGFSWLAVSVLNARLNSFQQASEDLAKALGGQDWEIADQNSADTQAAGEDLIAEEIAGEEVVVNDIMSDAGAREAFIAICGRIAEGVAELDEVRIAVEREVGRTLEGREERRAEIGRLAQAIAVESQRVQKAESLLQERDTLQERIAEHQQHIGQRELADELLIGAGRQISQQFNEEVRELVSHTLPLFTEGRYALLEIDDNLNVRVFSNEKKDFMGMEEISSGTQRQIMLAVRLALSQRLINGIGAASQFIFLDEPFAFFDQARTQSSLAALPELSNEISQIWVVAQAFPSGSDFERHIECSRAFDTLGVLMSVPPETPAVFQPAPMA